MGWEASKLMPPHIHALRLVPSAPTCQTLIKLIKTAHVWNSTLCRDNLDPETKKTALYTAKVLETDGSVHLEPALHDTSRRAWRLNYSKKSHPCWLNAFDQSIILRVRGYSIQSSGYDRYWQVVACVFLFTKTILFDWHVYILAKACSDSALILVCTGNRTRWTRWFCPNKSLSVMRCYQLRAQLNGHIKYTLPTTW